MSGWVGAWLKGKETEQEEKKEEDKQMDSLSADEIRNKRLERLAQLEQASTVMDVTPPQPPPIVATPSVVAAPIATQEQPKKSSAAVKQPRNLVDETLRRVLRVSLKPSSTYSFLESYAATCSEPLITPENIAEVLFTRISCDMSELNALDQSLNTLMYLIESYNRAESERQMIASRSKETLEKALAEIQNLCINYAATSLTEPEMCPHDEIGQNLNALKTSLARGDLSPMFLQQLATQLEQEGNIKAVFEPVFQELISKLFTTTDSILNDFFSSLTVINSCCKVKSIANVLADMTGFLLLPGATKTGASSQQSTALGLMLKFTSESNDPAIIQMFSNITTRTKPDVESSIKSLRNKCNMLQNLVTDLVRLLLKAGGTARQRVLDWLNEVMSVNAERAKENPNRTIVSSSGMFANLTVVLLHLCEPFFDPNSSKAKLIQLDFVQSTAMDSFYPSDTTRLIHDDNRTATERIAKEYNFITQCFFITARAIHLGPISSMRQYSHLMQQLSFLQNRMQQNEQAKLQFERLAAMKMMIDAYLLDELLLGDLLRFGLLSCSVMRRICTGEDQIHQLPLPSPPPSVCYDMPEHLIDDIGTLFTFISRFEPQNLSGLNLEELITFLVVFLSSPDYVASPHLRAQMSKVMFYVFLPPPDDQGFTTGHVQHAEMLLSTHPLAQAHLAPSLLALYGDVEHTGFYDKLEHRYNIACLLKYLWRLEQHKVTFKRISQNKTTFVRFVNGLMNHINGLVTDALTNLPEIKALQEEMANVTIWLSFDESTREQKQDLLREKERTVASSLQLANETIHMMSFLTSEIQEPFLVPELEDRLTAMLTNVLVKLCGPRGVELRVANPEEYKFRPKVMLKEIVETILHFASFESFQLSVARSGFYNPSIFIKALTILKRIQLLDTKSIAIFEEFCAKVENLNQTTQDIDQDDIPEEYLDALMCTLMEDPVTLPSGYVVDRTTINQHLLNDETDPFTRVPLKETDIVSNESLKQQIQTFLSKYNKS